MNRDEIEEPADYGDGVTYIECLVLGRLDPLSRAQAIGRALITPLHAAEDGLDDMQRLRLWSALIAYLLGVAEGSVGDDGREAIVQTMRDLPASRELIRQQ